MERRGPATFGRAEEVARSDGWPLCNGMPPLDDDGRSHPCGARVYGFCVLSKQERAGQVALNIQLVDQAIRAACKAGAEGQMNLAEERVIYRERFQAQHFDFRGKSIFTRFDDCEFVKCTLLIDHGTEQLAFTGCVFKDCNIDKLEPDEKRGLYVRDNFFDRPLDERRAEFEKMLTEALAARKAKEKNDRPDG